VPAACRRQELGCDDFCMLEVGYMQCTRGEPAAILPQHFRQWSILLAPVDLSVSVPRRPTQVRSLPKQPHGCVTIELSGGYQYLARSKLLVSVYLLNHQHLKTWRMQ